MSFFVFGGGGGGGFNLTEDSVENIHLRNSVALSVIGRSTNSTGDPADISAGANDRVLARTGDTLGFVQLTVGMFPDNAITYAKLQDVSAASRVLGRGSAAGAGDPVELTLGASLVMNGTTIERAALTGDVTAGQNSNALTIADDAVTYAKIQDVSAASRVLGRGSAAGAGDPQELTLGASLVMNGTVIERAALTGDVTAGQNSNALTIANDAVTYAKMQNVSATDRILGRISSGAGDPEEVVFTDQAQQLCDDTSFADMRTTLGLGTAATQNTGTSGANVPLLDGQNDWSMRQDFNGAINVNDGTTQGGVITLGTGFNSVFSASGGTLTINAAAYTLAMGGTLWRPTVDNNTDLGSASFRFQDIFATNGTIQTSDARDKTALTPIPEGVRRAARRIMAGVGVFQWRASVAEKGAGGARLHVGVTAQAVRDAFLAEGEDPTRWGLFCEDEVVVEEITKKAPWWRFWNRTDETSPVTIKRLGVRYTQLCMLLLKAQWEQIDALTARVAALEPTR